MTDEGDSYNGIKVFGSLEIYSDSGANGSLDINVPSNAKSNVAGINCENGSCSIVNGFVNVNASSSTAENSEVVGIQASASAYVYGGHVNIESGINNTNAKSNNYGIKAKNIVIGEVSDEIEAGLRLSINAYSNNKDSVGILATGENSSVDLCNGVVIVNGGINSEAGNDGNTNAIRSDNKVDIYGGEISLSAPGNEEDNASLYAEGGIDMEVSSFTIDN